MLYSATPSAITATSAFLIAFGIVYLWRSYSKADRRLPPGPSGLPLLGNAFQVPGKIVILIGDLKLAKELLEKHSAKHSSRPVLPYVRKYVDPENDFWALGEECESHSLGRKLTAGIMSLVRTGKTEPLQEYEAAINIQHLLDDGSKDWYHHIERMVEVLAEAIYLVTPTASITNKLPFLDWIPGPMPWRTRARSFRKRLDTLYEKLVDDAITGKASGMNTWAAFFAKEDKPEGDRRRLATTSLHTFVLACIRFPDWIATAQKEIDNVVGTDRLPTFKDRPFLPFVDAIVRVRAGAPHLSIADDVIEYQGQQYFIPKGSIIFAVTWAIEHDQSRFEDHDQFMPERFLDSEGKLRSNYETSAFGFGRRSIPFGERLLWINIVTMLWTFNIRASDEIDPRTGLPFQYDDSNPAFDGNLAKSPLKFPAVFEPRCPQRVEVARREWVECEKDLSILMPAAKDS
ncbi:hypothetical protein C0995_016389 [Termitomyces sp. Mi166|nr:hypothetical protein C0995_016389 [Termitomyces sp. Mi166\